MIVCSSHRPHLDSPEIAVNQARAKISWEEHFEKIVYFGDPEPELASPKTTFVYSDAFPRIADLALQLAQFRDKLGAIVNADIVIGPNFTKANQELIARNAKAGMSRRRNFENPAKPFDASMTDLGIDFFFASHGMWQMLANEIPKQYRIGHCLWDTWVMAFFARWAGSDCYDLTPQRFVFHPVHGDRRAFHPIDTTVDVTLSHFRWPAGRLRCCLNR